MREAWFKKLSEDSKILGIGSLFRGLGNKSWALNIDFNGGASQSLQFSNIPVIARKRVLNATKPYDLAGKLFDFTISNTQTWNTALASDCSAYNAHKHGSDFNQSCFVAKVEGVRVFIPQLEMARVLFYHDPFLARLSLQHNSLSEDFILQIGNDGQPLIVVREGAEYPTTYFNRDDNRRFLSWVLLDSSARASFESISTHLIKNQTIKNGYHRWNFQFTPPLLNGVKVGVRGWHDNASKTFFVWEITKLDGLPSDVTGEIDFFHPRYERRIGGRPTKGDGTKGEAPEQFELDDDELSDTDKVTLALLSERVSVSFKTPFITNRVAHKNKSVNSVIGDNVNKVLDKNLSPNEKEEGGRLPGGAWNNLDDQTDDAHLYLGKFQSFFQMVESLVVKYDCLLINKDITKLPKLGDGKKHWLEDTQNPRCLAIVELEHKNKFFTLLEVDTSDGAAKLSTMLVTSGTVKVEINKTAIAQGVINKSLGWPSDIFKRDFGEEAYKGIPHPKSKHPGSLPPEEIGPWAQRVANWMSRLN